MPIVVLFFVLFFLVVHYVMATHIVNPGHFYVRYMIEHKTGQKLSKKITEFCSGENSLFTFNDEIKTGMCMLSLNVKDACVFFFIYLFL